MPLQGSLAVNISHNGHTVSETAYVCPGNGGNLLSGKLATQLGLMHMANTVTMGKDNNFTNKVKAKFPRLFSGIGKLKNYSVKLHINRSIKPVANTHRRIPFHLRDPVGKQLGLLFELDIIEPVEGPTPWVSPAVVTTKPHDNTQIRICVDMTEANKAIERERHITPTLDDILSDLDGAVVFSALDLAHGYHQLELDEESRFITTFSTHVGLWRYKRLFFGVNSAAVFQVYQNAIRQTLAGLEGAINVSDDILVWVRSMEEHDRRLKAVLSRLDQVNITLNEAKCRFRQAKIRFMGSSSPKKVFKEILKK